MYVRIRAFISIVLLMHVLVSATWNRHAIKSIFSLDQIEMFNIISFYELQIFIVFSSTIL